MGNVRRRRSRKSVRGIAGTDEVFLEVLQVVCFLGPLFAAALAIGANMVAESDDNLIQICNDDPQ